MIQQGVNRRAFFKAAGVGIALPFLESITPFTNAAPSKEEQPRRMIAICAALGLCPDFLFPKSAGNNYELTPYLEVVKDFRDQFTICSGLSHPGVNDGHFSEASFLTAAKNSMSPNFKNSVSLDQHAVETLKPNTRFTSLTLSTTYSGVSVNQEGTLLPPENSPAALFKKMFVNGTAKEVAQQQARLKSGQSVLDVVRVQAKELQGQVSSNDRDRLDQYFTAVRKVEQELRRAEEWAKRPKPKVSVPPPTDLSLNADFTARLRLLLDLTHLAFETDSTRFVTLKIDLYGSYHHESHHGLLPEAMAKVKQIELRELAVVRDFLGKLRGTKEKDSTLLDRTMVLYGSNLGNAASHKSKNLPILLWGGGFKHGQHLAFDPANNFKPEKDAFDRNETPLCNLFVTMLQRLGIETDRFASSTGRLKGLELV
jgi:hypothetical protein